jgi:hypothetical protein
MLKVITEKENKILTKYVMYWTHLCALLELVATDPEALIRAPALPDFPRSSGSGTGCTQPREYN